MNVLVVSLLLIALFVTALLVALADPELPRRLLGRLALGGSQEWRPGRTPR